MDRISTFSAVVLVTALMTLTGCTPANKKPADNGGSAPPPAAFNDQPANPSVSSLPPGSAAPPPAAGATVPIGPDTSAGPAPIGPAPSKSGKVAGVPGGTYVVKAGDTLYGIARKIYHDPKMIHAIEKANPGLDADHIKVGQKINLP